MISFRGPKFQGSQQVQYMRGLGCMAAGPGQSWLLGQEALAEWENNSRELTPFGVKVTTLRDKLRRTQERPKAQTVESESC